MLSVYYDAIVIDSNGNIRELEQVNEKTLKDVIVGCVNADIRYHEHNSTYRPLRFWSFLFQD